MTSSSSAATTRRRKIFPHLEDEKRSASDAAADGDGDGGGRGRGATNDDVGDVATRKGNEKDDKHSSTYNNAKSKKGKKSGKPSSIPKTEGGSSSSISITHQHLLPLPLVLTVLVCSGIFWIASFRDVMATGKPILDTLSMIWGQEDADANYLVSLYT